MKPMDPKPYITHTFEHKASIYSKSMAITTVRTGVSYHTMQIILSIFYMHVILQVSLG
jgi:hypothetical protein